MKPLRDKAYLNQVRALPCCVCLEHRSDLDRVPHHLMRGVVRGTGMKAPDNWTVPLCHTHHNTSKDSVHLCGMDERDWFVSKGIPDVAKMAQDLYAARGNHTRMLHAMRMNIRD